MGDSPVRSMKKSTKKLAPIDDMNQTSPTQMVSGQKTIQRKKDLIEAVRRLNPAGTNAAPTIFWDVEGSLKTGVIDDSGVEQQLNIVESGVNYSARRYNDLRVMNDKLTKELKQKLDMLEEQKMNWESLDAMKNATTDEGMRIEALQKELVSVEDEIAAKSHYTRQLEHVLLRLKQNQLKFEAHMVGMEEAMHAVQKEGQEVRLLRRGLDAGLAKAISVYEETLSNLASARKDREVLIAQRRSEVKNALLLQEWLVDREHQKAVLAIELRGDLTKNEETFLKSQISEKIEKTKKLQKANEDSNKKLLLMEELFTKIKQVTGVVSLNEMHEKFFNQKNNKKNLEQEVKDTEARLVIAKKTYLKKEKQFQEIKNSCVGITDLTRDMTDKLEVQINNSRNELKICKASTTRLQSVLLGLEQGSNGLHQRVLPYVSIVDGGVFDLTKGVDITDVTMTLDDLSTAEQVLAKMIEIINGAGDVSSPIAKLGGMMDLDNDDISVSDSKSINTTDEAPAASHNIRIKSKRILRDSELDDESFNHTDKVGNSSMININAMTTFIDGNNLNSNDAGDDNIQLHMKSAKAFSSGHNTNGIVDDPNVPSRLLVKKNSLRKSQEHLRKEEMESRRKRLAERMAAQQATKIGTADGDDAGINKTARLKAQVAMANRLCTIQAPPTLPEGVTLRDDIMSKTNAFLTKMPKLV